MSLASRVRKFLAPWLTFAVLNGLGSLMLCALLSLAMGVITLTKLALMKPGDRFWLVDVSTFAELPSWLVSVLQFNIHCFLAGCLMGLIAALVGGTAGRGWSSLSFFGITSIACSFSTAPNPLNLVSFWLLGTVGSLLPKDFLESGTPRLHREGSLRQQLRNSWLRKPPYLVRFIGLLLPIGLGFLVTPLFTLPVYLDHQNYVARLGAKDTWEKSQLFATRPERSKYAPSCYSNLQQIMWGLMQYQEDYDEFLPPKPSTPQDGVAAILQPYLKSTQLFQCPQEFYKDDGKRFSSGDFNDYWYNARIYGLSSGRLTSPEVTVAWGDGNTGSGEANAAYSLQSIPTDFPPARRHFDKAIYAFADGHVKWLKPGVVSNNAPSSGSVPTMNP